MINFDDWQPLEGYVYYRSGLGRSPSDLKGLIEACAPIGVSATDLRPSVIGLLLDYLRHKGEVFVDSGAFGAFRSGQAVDWDQVMNTYAELADHGHSGHLSAVMPDVIGDSWKTLSLVCEYQETIGQLMEMGVRCILPWQVQVWRPDDFMEALWQMVDHDIAGNLVPGIPSNAKALNLEAARRIVILGHSDVHLLGMGENNARFAETVRELRSVDYDLEITADSNPLPAWYSRGGRGARFITRMKSLGVSAPAARREFARRNAGPNMAHERRLFERYGIWPCRPDLQAALPPIEGVRWPAGALCQMSFI